LFIVLFWTITPALRTHAIYVPDGSNNPYWVPLNSSDIVPSGGPDMGDANENNVADWYDNFQAAANAGTLTWWGGGSSFNGNPFVVDGVAVTFPAQWYLPVDADGDGIPDNADPYPNDSANNSFWWPGGAVQCNGVHYFVRARWFSGSAADGNANGAPDGMEPLLANLSDPNYYYWPGGTFLIDGQSSSYAPIYIYGYDTGDADGDGIPDAIDPYPSDPWNNTQFYWGGGDWFINGISTHFDAGTHGGFGGYDSDADGIPDSLDPYPMDPANNTTWWGGGTFLLNGTLQTYYGCYHAANAGDSDGDGIPDDLDPYPYDQSNNSDWWGGGYWPINGISVYLPGQWHLRGEADTDGDNIPNSLDPYPGDASNNSFWWGGGTFTIDNGSITFPGDYYPGAWTDGDYDGIPDSLDPYAGDPVNGNHFYWAGGTFAVNNAWQTWPAGFYPGSWADSDGDGIPDSLDQYPNDAANNSSLFWWWGGGFYVDGLWQTFPAQICFGQLDPYGYFPDADHDGIPDSIDPYPTDLLNNTPGIVWPPLDMYGASTTVSYPVEADNHLQYFTTAVYYFTPWQDTDGDGIPDVADPYPQDTYNGNDTDGDGIPDAVEVAYGLNRYDASDASSIRYINGQTDGITWKQAYDHGWLDMLQDNVTDTDGDGMSDLYETVNGLDLHNPADAVDAPIAYLPSGTTATANDFILNIEKARAGIPLSHIVTDAYEYYQITGQWWSGPPSHDFTKSVAENDWDGDGVSNWDEVLVFHTDVRNASARPSDADLLTAYLASQTSLTTNLNFATLFATMDTDGDGIPDVVEYQYTQYGLSRTVGSDAGQIRYMDGLTDWLTWKQAFDLGIIGTLLSFTLDSDGDGIPDVVEIQFSRDRFNPADAAELRYVVNPADGIPYTEGLTWKQAYDLDPNLESLHYLSHLLSFTLDSDGDGIPDLVEYQFHRDRFNPADAAELRYIVNPADGIAYTDFLTWKQAYDLDPNLETLHYLSQLLSFTLDSDEDGIPDVVELQFSRDRFNPADADELRYVVDPADGIAYTDFLTWKQAYDLDPETLHYLSHLLSFTLDSDGDGIPDVVENQYHLDRFNPADAGDIRFINGQTDGVTWKQAYDHGWLDTLQDTTVDTDGDGMTDLYENLNGLDMNNPADAVDAPIAYLPPGTTATMNDFILNIEKARANVPLSYVVTETGEYLAITGHWPNEGISHDFNKSVADNDWDGDGVTNGDEVLFFHTDPRDATSRATDVDLLDAYLAGDLSVITSTNLATVIAAADSDGDGIPDLVEIQYGLNRHEASDANSLRYVGTQTDGLKNKDAYDLGLMGTLAAPLSLFASKADMTVLLGQSIDCSISATGAIGTAGIAISAGGGPQLGTCGLDTTVTPAALTYTAGDTTTGTTGDDTITLTVTDSLNGRILRTMSATLPIHVFSEEQLGAMDTDMDGYSDLEEMQAGTNPNDASDKPTYAPFNAGGTISVAYNAARKTYKFPTEGGNPNSSTQFQIETKKVSAAQQYISFTTDWDFSTVEDENGDPVFLVSNTGEFEFSPSTHDPGTQIKIGFFAVKGGKSVAGELTIYIFDPDTDQREKDGDYRIEIADSGYGDSFDSDTELPPATATQVFDGHTYTFVVWFVPAPNFWDLTSTTFEDGSTHYLYSSLEVIARYKILVDDTIAAQDQFSATVGASEAVSGNTHTLDGWAVLEGVTPTYPFTLKNFGDYINNTAINYETSYLSANPNTPANPWSFVSPKIDIAGVLQQLGGVAHPEVQTEDIIKDLLKSYECKFHLTKGKIKNE
jgi:hypothetical protein